MEGRKSSRHRLRSRYKLTGQLFAGFWFSLAAQNSASPVDGLGHSWPEYGESQDMVLFGNKTGATLVVRGDYFDKVLMCDEL
jgi:hypothetical protein